MTEVGFSCGGTRLVMCDLHIRFTEPNSVKNGTFQNSWSYKWTQSVSSSQSGRNRGAAAEADEIGEQQMGAAAEGCPALDCSQSS